MNVENLTALLTTMRSIPADAHNVLNLNFRGKDLPKKLSLL